MAAKRLPKSSHQSVYQRISAELEAEVRRDMRPGTRLPPEVALAERFQVSTLTIREAVACLVQRGLVERRRGSGTYVIDPFASQHIGVLVNLDLSRPESTDFWMPLAQQLRHYLTTCGYRVRLYAGHMHSSNPPQDTELAYSAEMVDDLENRRLVGLAAIGAKMDPDLERELHRQGIPLVGSSREKSDCVINDYRRMVQGAARRLAEAGCKRLGALLWGIDAEACRTIYEEFDLPWQELLEPGRHPTLPGAGYVAMQRLLSRTRCDGLILTDELYLPGVALALAEHNLEVPADIRIVTHANEGAHVFAPLPVTAMVVSPIRNAEALSGLLMRRLRGEELPPHSVNLPFRWEERPQGSPKDWQLAFHDLVTTGDSPDADTPLSLAAEPLGSSSP